MKQIRHGSELLREWMAANGLSGPELVLKMNARAEQMDIVTRVDKGQISRLLSRERESRLGVYALLAETTGIPIVSWLGWKRILKPIKKKARRA